jgi:UDP-glucose 4-epimerase
MKAVVFGGAGFLGSHVADSLTDSGYEVTIFDQKKSPYLQPTQEENIGSILKKEDVDTIVEHADVVYNFAAISDIGDANKNPVETVKHNILGNTIILDACRKNNVNRFVFASSLYVYSKVGAVYRSSKQACELLIENYNELYDLPYTILRYGSLYGPRSDERNYIYQIIKQAIKTGEIISFGEGNDLREYIHVQDAARYSVEILNKEFENQYVILTGNQPMRRKDLLIMIKEMMDNKIDIKYEKKESEVHYEITPYSFSPKIAKKYVGQHHLDLGQGILQCINDVYETHHPHEEINGIIVK